MLKAVLNIKELSMTVGFMEDLAFCIGSPIRRNIILNGIILRMYLWYSYLYS